MGTNRGSGGSRAQTTGSHVTGTGSDITGTGSYVTGTEVTSWSRKWSGKPLTGWKKGSRVQGTGSHVIWKGKPQTTVGSESKVQIRHRGEVGSDKEDAMLEKKNDVYSRLGVTNGNADPSPDIESQVQTVDRGRPGSEGRRRGPVGRWCSFNSPDNPFHFHECSL